MSLSSFFPWLKDVSFFERILLDECLSHVIFEVFFNSCVQSNDKLFAHFNRGPCNSSSHFLFLLSSLEDVCFASSDSFFFGVENKTRLIFWVSAVLLVPNNLLGPAWSDGGLWNNARFEVSNLDLHGLDSSSSNLRTTFFFAELLGLLPRGLLPLGLLPRILLPLGLFPFLCVSFLYFI